MTFIEYKEHKLPYTLQTHVGMVKNGGRPCLRDYPCSEQAIQEEHDLLEGWGIAHVWSSYTAPYEIFTACILERKIPKFTESDNSRIAKRLRFNIRACLDSEASLDFMKKSVMCQKRLDLEQVAAIVCSAIINDDNIPDRASIVSSLIRTIHPSVLLQSSMWLDECDTLMEPRCDTQDVSHITDVAERILHKYDIDIGSTLLPVLMRVRRCRPVDKTRCLFIPEWIFNVADVTVPEHYQIWNSKGMITPGCEPTHPAAPDSIILSRRDFRRLQRRLLRIFKFWDPVICLRKAIKDLEQDVLYSVNHLKRNLLPSTDTLAVASHFVAVQRRLQRKVVSDTDRIRFLGKGECSIFLQNAPHLKTAFERCLEDVAIVRNSRSGVKQQGAIPIEGAILPQIDQCCLLMEFYVLNHTRDGRKEDLTFRRGVSGGSGRGPVDDYNLLCDIFYRLRSVAREKGIKTLPGPVRKFLAKDIMAWNKSWEDDAFAGGFVPGWEPWLEERREKGTLLQEWESREET